MEKSYFVNFEKGGEFISTFLIGAKNLKHAKEVAQTYKRLEKRNCKTIVRRSWSA